MLEKLSNADTGISESLTERITSNWSTHRRTLCYIIFRDPIMLYSVEQT
jgi:hypothetical protein